MSLTGMAFLASYGMGLLFALARHPVFGLAVYVAVLFLDPPSRWWGVGLPGLRWSLIAALITLIAYLAHANRLPKSPSIGRQRIFFAFVLLLGWMAIQFPWVIWIDEQVEILELYIKYLILLYLIYKILADESQIRTLLWSYLFGCFYLGWIAYSGYSGGRFESFGGVNIGESNAGALTLATGVFAAGPLFLTGSLRERAVLIGLMPFIVNGIITAQSRGAFLALVTGAAIFIYFSPAKFRRRLLFLSCLGAMLFLMLTNEYFWGRMSSLKHAGEEGVLITTETGNTYETGHGRLEIISAQWQMFLDHPLGTGHRGTAALSPFYLPQEALTGPEGQRFRASHNTFFTMLVEHGIVGALVYLYMLWWIVRSLLNLRTIYGQRADFVASLVPALAAIFACLTVGDVFVDYFKLEPRIWFLGLLMVVVKQTQTLTPPERHFTSKRTGTTPVGARHEKAALRIGSTGPSMFYNSFRKRNQAELPGRQMLLDNAAAQRSPGRGGKSLSGY